MSIAANNAAEITPAVIVVATHRLRKRAGAHELVGGGQVRAACSAAFGPGYEFPAALGEETVIAARHECRPVFQCYPEGGLDRAPMREHARLRVTPVPANAPRAVDFIADPQFRDAARPSNTHEDQRVTRATVITSMLASSIRIDRALEGNVGRIVVADDRARTLGLERRGDAVGCLLEVPAIIHRLELLEIEAAGRVGQCSPAGEGMPARDRSAHGGTVHPYSTPVKPPAAIPKTLQRRALSDRAA